MSKRLRTAIAAILEDYDYEEVIDELAKAASEDEHEDLSKALVKCSEVASTIEDEDEVDDDAEETEDDEE